MNNIISNDNTSNSGSGASITPLKFFQPQNIIVFFSFFSPVILAVTIVSLSFIFQNFKGFIYLGYLLCAAIIRNFVYKSNGGEPAISDNTICTSVQYTQYGNPTFSIFVFAFTIMYICMPMFMNNSINYWVLVGLIVYVMVDI